MISKVRQNSTFNQMIFCKKKWLPDQDLNLDKLNQNQLCYRYTIGQSEILQKMAPAAGFEPATKWLTATYSTAELCRSVLPFS